jgi:hypothetical protein
VTFVEPEGILEGRRVHLADIDATISSIGHQLHPAESPGFVIAEHTVGMRIDAGEQAGPRRRAGGRGNVGLAEIGALPDHPVEVRRLHVRKAGGRDRVEPLLVGDDEDDVCFFLLI